MFVRFLICVLVGLPILVIGWVLITGLRSGRIWVRNHYVSRSDEAVRYWVIVAVLAGFGVYLAYWLVRLTVA